MSGEQIELHKFVVGSPSSPGKMSSTDALLNSTQTDGHTEVGPMGPLYQTVPEAQRSHTQYTTEPVHVVTRGDNVYTVPSESDPPNEYDFINERQPRGGQVKHVAENVLYADQATADKFRHAATMEKAGSFKFTGSVSEGVKEPTGDGITCCRCKMKDVFYCFFHLIGIVLGVAALALAVVIILGAIPIGSSCNCNTNNQDDVQELRAMVSRLNRTLNTLQQNTTSISNSLGQVMQNVESNSTSLNQLVQNVESINNTGIAAQVNSILDARTPTLPPNFSAELRSVETHRNCTTSVENSCTIQPNSVVPSAPCETNDVPLHMEGFYTADVLCAKIDRVSEANAVTAILQVNVTMGVMRCLCYVVAPNPTFPQTDPISCGLIVTRCPSENNIRTNIHVVT